MSSMAIPTTRRKKSRRLGPGQVMHADQYEALDVDSKGAGIQALIPLGLMHVREVLEEEVCLLAGARLRANVTRERKARNAFSPDVNAT